MAINTFFPCNYRYPYTNDHELNLGWVLATIKAQESSLSKFVALNTVKYADPFDWDITHQYATNTVVFNPADMTAYLSVQPVPSGVQIDNTEYWTPIFTLADIFTAYKTSITPVEQIAAKPATQDISKGQLLWIDNVLYEAVRDISHGTVIVPGENVVTTNISDELADQEQNIQAEQTAREQADQAEQTAREQADQAEQTAREQADQQLRQSIQAEQTAREQADQQLRQEIRDLSNTLYVDVTAYGADKNGLVDSYSNIMAAMADAERKGISIIYFPSGKYLVDKQQILLDTSKFQFLGGADTTIKGTVTDKDFIVLTSPLSLRMYDLARVPLKNLCIEGTTFTDTGKATNAAISFGKAGDSDATLVSPHLCLENVVVRNWECGIALRTAYKTDFFNCSVIACNNGILIPSAGIAQAVPTTFVGCFFECCNIAIYSLAGGYNCLYFYGGAFEYNRSVFSGYVSCIFTSVRFELDVLASCSDPSTYRYVFNASGRQNQYIKFNKCSFLALHNFSDNVAYWITEPYTLSTFSGAVFFGYVSSQSGKAVYYFDSCELSFDAGQFDPASYLVSANNVFAVANNVIGGATNIFNPSQLKTSENGLLS